MDYVWIWKLQDYSEISNFHNSSFHSAQIENSMFTVVSIECGHLDYWCKQQGDLALTLRNIW